MTDQGSAVLEGIGGIAIAFLLLTLVAQAAFLVVARNAAQSAVDQAARKAARVDADLVGIEDELVAALNATVPGAGDASATVGIVGRTIRTTAKLDWNPPGPRWATITIRVESEASLSVAP